MIECKVCGRKFKMLTNSHLKSHGLTPDEYMKKFPGEKLYDHRMRKKYIETRHRVARPICLHPKCENECRNRTSKYCSYKCAMSHRMSKDGRNEQAGSRNHMHVDMWYALEKGNKKIARQRDNSTCQRCREVKKGKGLHVHHIIPERYFKTAQEAHALNNLICLCSSCHRKVETELMKELYDRAMILEKPSLRKSDEAPVPLAIWIEESIKNPNFTSNLAVHYRDRKKEN